MAVAAAGRVPLRPEQGTGRAVLLHEEAASGRARGQVGVARCVDQEPRNRREESRGEVHPPQERPVRGVPDHGAGDRTAVRVLVVPDRDEIAVGRSDHPVSDERARRGADRAAPAQHPVAVYDVTARSRPPAGPDTTATLPEASAAIRAAWPALSRPAERPPAVHSTGTVVAPMAGLAVAPISISVTPTALATGRLIVPAEVRWDPFQHRVLMVLSPLFRFEQSTPWVNPASPQSKRGWSHAAGWRSGTGKGTARALPGLVGRPPINS